MNTFLYIVQGICFIGILHSFYMLFRVKKVYKYKTKLLNEVSSVAKLDIAIGREWEWRYQEYESVSFRDMTRKFWKPLDSFYKDKGFLSANVTQQKSSETKVTDDSNKIR